MNDKLAKLRRFLILSKYQRDYVRLLKKSGSLDKDFYKASQPRMHWFFRPFPERHYVTIGESLGISPNETFNPFGYFAANPDIPSAQFRPLDHFLRFGQNELRPTQLVAEEVLEALGEYPKMHRATTQRVHDLAIVIHLYFLDLWPEFRDMLASLDIEADVYVTVTNRGDESDDLVEQIRSEVPDANVFSVPNLGRDIYPFVHLLNAGLLSGYEAVCKIHGKKSLHRGDGAQWRLNLVGDLLPGAATGALVERFLADEDALMLTGDGQMYIGDRWWGSNRDRVKELLARNELSCGSELSPFPGGSMYWMKPLMVDLLRGMRLRHEDFEPEFGQLDGTTAHAVERLFGFISESAGMRVATPSDVGRSTPVQGVRGPGELARPSYVTAFYLPQFHPTPYNDEWWGRGFTEWTSVTRAESNFLGHVQPYLPSELGFYDLRVIDTMATQRRLAEAAGIDAFCVYHYWFDEDRLLDEPMNNLLKHPEVDFPFYLCWANESWRRNWDGLSGVTLMGQEYNEGFELRLAKDVAPYMADERYQSPAGVPRFLIYRLDELPDPTGAVNRLRQAFETVGVGQVEIGAVRFHLEAEEQIADDAVDFWVEMPPHGVVDPSAYLVPQTPTQADGLDVIDLRLAPGYQGLIYDYSTVVDRSISQKYRSTLPSNTIAGVMPSWDNTARRGREAHIAWGGNPANFRRWLQGIRAHLPASYHEELFVNAWNEWGEKAVLEPSLQFGDANLQVLRAAVLNPADATVGATFGN